MTIDNKYIFPSSILSPDGLENKWCRARGTGEMPENSKSQKVRYDVSLLATMTFISSMRPLLTPPLKAGAGGVK